MRYSGKNVLVLGGTGFIGSRLAERLRIEEGANVRVLVHSWRNATWVSRSDIELIEGDICSEGSLLGALKNINIVFDCVEGGYRVNVEGTKNLFNTIQKYNLKVKVVYLSSIAVFGPQPKSDVDSNEKYVYYKSNDYAISKIESEKIIKEYSEKHGIPYVIIRPTYVWGPNSQHFTIGPILQMKSNNFFLVNQGTGIANAVYVDNLVDAIIEAGTNKNAINKSFVITDDSGYTWGELFNYYGNFLGRKLRTLYYKSENKKISAFEIKHAIFKHCTRFIRELKVINSFVFKNKSSKIYKINNFLLNRINNLIINKVLFYDEWDLNKFNNHNKIEIKKAKEILNYHPRFDLKEGMEITKKWLEIQNYQE
jgi:nucleoside-diphosphate-sugar epimerase